MKQEDTLSAWGPHDGRFGFQWTPSLRETTTQWQSKNAFAQARVMVDEAVDAMCDAAGHWEDRGDDEKRGVLEDLRRAGTALLKAISGEAKLDTLRKLLGRARYLQARNEENIPWEFLYLGQDDGDVDLNAFFGAGAVVSRSFESDSAAWPVGNPSLLRDSVLGAHPEGLQLVCGLAQDQRLHSARTGAEADILTSGGLVLSELPSLKPAGGMMTLEQFVQKSDLLTHFNCHADEEKLGLSPKPSGLYVTEAFWVDRHKVGQLPLCENSVVVLNCCYGATMKYGVEDTMSGSFASRGVAAVVATTNKVPDQSATVWAKYFYDEFLSFKTVGESILDARKKMLIETGNPVALLYAFQGRPDAGLPRALELT